MPESPKSRQIIGVGHDPGKKGRRAKQDIIGPVAWRSALVGRFYVDRVVGGDRSYRDPGFVTAAGARARQGSWSRRCLQEQPAPAWLASATYGLDNKGRFPYFLDWLYSKPGDLTTGRLYPYLKSKGVYLCPTDKLILATNIRLPAPPTAPVFGNINFPRDYSYAMNCGLCHESDPAKFIAPTRTLAFMEADLARNDYSGQVGPSFATRALATRHNSRGHLVFGDLHLESLNAKVAGRLERSRTFWFPTADMSGPGGMSFNLNLPDP